MNFLKLSPTHIILLFGLLGWGALQGCSTTKPYAEGPVKTFDPDTSGIDMPPEQPQFQYWDRIDNTLFHQLEKPLDLNRTFRLIGRGLGMAGERQADNVNKLDEVPESSWYTRRHYYTRMSTEELATGQNTAEPDTGGTWTIFSAKLEGANPGFFIRDENGNRFLIKFDGYQYPELSTSAEVIGSKIFHAAGYTVPEAAVVYFDPEKVIIESGVEVEENGRMREMTMNDYREIIKDRHTDENGRIRAVASKFVNGIPLGPWNFEGVVKTDPNDRVAHEHRRELRGMRVISSWLNDTDRRDANTMAVYNPDGYIDHYVQDFGNTLGANGGGIHRPIQGQAYLIDPRYMMVSALSLGGYVTPWETIDPVVTHTAVGYFRSDTFKPGRWVPTHPIPAFENMTLRDAFWGAKQVMSFSNDDIRAIVESAKISDPEAVEILVQTLIERRDKIGRYWFDKIDPLDKFRPVLDNHTLHLRFEDLSINGGLADPSEHSYEYDITSNGKTLFEGLKSSTPEISVALDPQLFDKNKPTVLEFTIHTLRNYTNGKSQNVVVYIELNHANNTSRLAGIRRGR